MIGGLIIYLDNGTRRNVRLARLRKIGLTLLSGYTKERDFSHQESPESEKLHWSD